MQIWESGMRGKEMKVRNALAVLTRWNSEAARHRERIGASNFNRNGETIMRRFFVSAGMGFFVSGATLAQGKELTGETRPPGMYIPLPPASLQSLLTNAQTQPQPYMSAA